MKKVALILLIVIGAVTIGIRVLGANARQTPSGVTSVQAQAYQMLSTRSLHSMRLVSAPVIDGDLSDWPAGETISLNRQTAFSFSGQIDSPADLSAIIRSGWDQQTLYFAIEVSNDVIVTDSSDVWRDDGVEIGLDGLNDKDAWGLDDHQYTLVADGRTTDRSVPTGDIAASVATHQGGYDIEVAIPMSKLLPGVPISGTVMGFTIGLHDDDDGDNWDAYLIWEGTNTSSSPEEFGSLIFTERLEDRIVALEAKIIQLEQQVQELLAILSEFEELTPP
jgi:hypothetical protein